jgi:4-hydroxy-tetrahydrodipicolinate synthase
MPALSGLLTAMITPFHEDGRVDEDAAVAMARHLLANGSDGLVVCGTTGEAATLTDEEHLGLIRLIAEECGSDALIVAGTGSNDTRHAIHLTEEAAAAGVDAVLSVTPYYNKPNARGIRRHFEEVARAAGGTPVVLYNIPGRTATNMPPELLADLAQIDGIEGLKQSNEDELQLIDGLAVFAGNDDILARTLDLGGAGGICVASHVVGPEMRRMFDEPDQRAEIDASLQELYRALFVTASPAPVKAALQLLGHRVGGLRLPLVEVDDEELAVVRRALEAHGLIAGATA